MIIFRKEVINMNRIRKEKETVGLMIKLYCKKKHSSMELCSQCTELLEYAKKKLSNCTYGNEKSYCVKCTTPCYNVDMKLKIKSVMRFSGPRLIIYKPMEFIRHLFE